MEGVSEKVVVFTGIGDAELAYLYQKADLFAMLNYNFRGDYEGFGIVFLEASYFGLPVIGGLDGGSRDAILEGETGYLVDPLQSSEKIVGYLNRLHDDSGLRRQLGRAGCDYVKSSNSWAHVAERIHFAMSHI
jgi:phosphatidylinositol alpha-1,6-mannosyltransferase